MFLVLVDREFASRDELRSRGDPSVRDAQEPGLQLHGETECHWDRVVGDQEPQQSSLRPDSDPAMLAV